MRKRALELINAKGLAGRLALRESPEPLGPLASDALQAVEEELWPVALLLRIEEACVFTRAHHAVGYDRGVRELLAERLERIESTLRSRLGPAPERAPLALSTGSSSEQAALAIEQALAVESTDPLRSLHATVVACRATARAPITRREPALTEAMELVWVPAGAVRALQLFALSRVRHASYDAFPELRGLLFEQAAKPLAPSGPFREAASTVSDEAPALAPTVLHRHLQRALLHTGIYESISAGRGAWPGHDPFYSGVHARGGASPFLERAILDLDAAALIAARDGLMGPETSCGALALDVIRRFRAIELSTLDADIRKAVAALDDLALAIGRAWGFEGEPRTLVAQARSEQHAGVRPDLAALMKALADPCAAIGARWSWCDDYFLAALCGRHRAPGTSWIHTVLPSRSPAERKRRALTDYLDKTRAGKPSSEDIRKAVWLAGVLDSRSPVAAVFFAIPSLRTLVRGVRTVDVSEGVTGKAFVHRVLGVDESAAVLDAFGRRAQWAFGSLVPAGQILERAVELQLFGEPGPWPQPPSYATEDAD